METEDGIEVYVGMEDLDKIRENVEKSGIKIVSADLVQKPTNTQIVSDESVAKKAIALLEKLNDHDDVQRVFSNLEIKN